MTYEELKKAYEESIKKCSELKKEIEDKNLRIEHLTELLIKRNKMLFGQKSEKVNIYVTDSYRWKELFSTKRKSSLISIFLSQLPILL